ncbi:MAG: PD40 domain-containing protein, partial [Kofleriaceae bacterium]|nr:PD40 domain-containing protein [Kofleriaceae bacterium]
MRGVFVFYGFALALLRPQLASAGDARLDWYTIESEHFIVSYHEPLGAVARRVALVAERAHEVLVPVMGHEPEEKTLVVVDDVTDSTNGFASVLPRNRIRILASAPSSKSNLADHDDWLYGLVAHEYAHILHLDNIDGLPRLVNKVVGKTWAPNQVQPRWIIEGIATYEESRYSSGGRLCNSLAQMLLRLGSLTGNERSLDEMTNGPRKWPQGNTAYIYGSHFLNYIFDRFGEKTVAEMSYNFGSSPIPYGLNRAIYKSTGKSFVELHSDWKDYQKELYGMEEEAIARRGLQEGRRLTFSGLVNINPAYTKDGKSIVWLHNSGTAQGHFSIMPAGGNYGDRSHYATINRAGEFDLLSDGSFILEITDNFRGTYSSQELFRYDPKTKATQRLTKRARMRDPKVSPDERQVAFVVTGQASRHLAVMDLRPEAEKRILWQGPDEFDQAFDPAWSPDGKTIAFSAWRKGGYKDILLVDTKTGKVRELSKNRAQDVDPVFDPSGRYLYFSSDRSGIYNVYAYDLQSEELLQITNVLGCAMTPAISPDGKEMVYRGCVSDGTELYQMPLRRSSWAPAKLYINDRPEPVSIADDAYAISEPRPYSPLATLAPKRYTLQFDPLANQLSVQIAGEDVIGRHNYTLATTVPFDTGDANISASYGYLRNWASLRVAGFRSIVQRGGFVVDDRRAVYREERLGLTLTMGLPVLRMPTGSGSLSVSYDFDRLRDVGSPAEQFDPNTTLSRRPETNFSVTGLALRFNYNDTRGATYTLGPLLGKAISMSMRMDHPALGSDFKALSLNYRLQTYYKLPWGQTPVLSLRVAGGIRISDRARASRFSLGGISEQNLVESVINSLRVGNTGFLRGYKSRAAVGTQMHLVNLEYRQELFDIETGL